MASPTATAATVDPSAAMSSYQKGADIIERQFPIAAKQFSVAADWANDQSVQYYLQGRQDNYAFSDTAQEATNELRKWLGMSPLDKAVPLADKARGIAQYFTTNDGNPAGGYVAVNDLADAMASANSLTDPAARAAAKGNILNKIDQLQQGINTDLAYYASRDTNRTKAFQAQLNAGIADPKSMPFSTQDPNQPYQDRGTFVNSISNLPIVTDSYNQDKDPTLKNKSEQIMNQTLKANAEALTQLNDLKTQFQSKYSETPEQAYSSKQIQDKLEATPGYTVQLAAGQKALERSQAATGMLQSGNAMIAATKYGEDYATNAYQSQIQHLSNLAGMTMPAAQQGIQNTMAQGGTVAGYTMANGQMQAQTTQDIARARETSFQKSGDAQLQAAMMNAQLKTQTSMANASMKGSMMGSIGSLAGSVAGMIL